jgi:hypothetical protein
MLANDDPSIIKYTINLIHNLTKLKYKIIPIILSIKEEQLLTHVLIQYKLF